MVFNHYAKIKQILTDEQPGWYIVRIDEATQSQNFKGETTYFEHYYRIYRHDGTAIKYCKFQQIERLAQVLGIPSEELPIIEENEKHE